MAVSLTEEARKRANLRLLQRSVDENIVDIVGNATHVVLYEFQNIGGWSKSDVEGSLFLVQIVQTQTKSNNGHGDNHNHHNNHNNNHHNNHNHNHNNHNNNKIIQLVILNRNSTKNFSLDITSTFQLQHKEPFLMFRQESTKTTRGIWFHNSNERVVVASLLNQIIHNLNDNNNNHNSNSQSRPTQEHDETITSITVPQQQQQQQQQQLQQQQQQQQSSPLSARIASMALSSSQQQQQQPQQQQPQQQPKQQQPSSMYAETNSTS